MRLTIKNIKKARKCLIITKGYNCDDIKCDNNSCPLNKKYKDNFNQR